MRIFAGVLMILLAGQLAAQPGPGAGGPAGPAAFDFHDGIQGWTSFDPSAAVTAAQGVDGATDGNCLQFRYRIAPGAMPIVLSPTVSAVEMAGIKIRLRTDADRTLVILAQEQNGARYVNVYPVRGKAWTTITLGFSQFSLSDDTKDTNDKLDAEEITNVGVVDADLMHAQNAAPEMRNLWLDSVQFIPAAQLQARAGVVDDFEDGMTPWIPIRLQNNKGELDKQTALSVTADPDNAANHVLEAKLDAPGSYITMLTRSGFVPFPADAATFHMRVRTAVPSVIVVTLAEQNKARYVLPVVVAKAATWQTVRVSLSDFGLDPDSTDPAGRLMPETVQQVVIADAGNMLKIMGLDQTKAQTLWLDDIGVDTTATPANCYADPSPQQVQRYWIERGVADSWTWLPIKVTMDKGKIEALTGATAEHAKLGDTPVLDLKYSGNPGQAVGFMHMVRLQPPDGAKSLTFKLAAKENASLVITLSEHQGGDYEAHLDIHASDTLVPYEIPLSEFQPKADKPDPDGRLDLNMIGSMSIADASAAGFEQSLENELKLTDLAFLYR